VPAIHLLISALYMCACVLFVLSIFAYLSCLFFPSFLSYLLFYLLPSRIWKDCSRSISRPEVVWGDRTWV